MLHCFPRTHSKPPSSKFIYINVAKGKLIFDKQTGQYELAFVITLSRSSAHEVDVDLETKGGTSDPGTNYLGVKKKTISFTPGKTKYTFFLPVEIKGQRSLGSFFYLKTIDPVGAQLGNGEGLGFVPPYGP